MLISREIIFQEFEPVLPRYLNVTDGQTDGRTDRQLALAIPRYAELRAAIKCCKIELILNKNLVIELMVPIESPLCNFLLVINSNFGRRPISYIVPFSRYLHKATK